MPIHRGAFPDHEEIHTAIDQTKEQINLVSQEANRSGQRSPGKAPAEESPQGVAVPAVVAS